MKKPRKRKLPVEVKRYRFVSADGTFATRWRALPQSPPRPSKVARERLGSGFSLELRMTLR